MTVKMIVAFNGQEIIGKDNKIPWFYKSDLQFFKKMTTGHVVIMGRKTWESLPPKMRPLPDRVNIVVTKSDGLSGPECTVPSVEEGVRVARSCYQTKDIWLIGGMGIYQKGMSIADECLVTLVPDVVETSDSVVCWPGFDSSWYADNCKQSPGEFLPRRSVDWKDAKEHPMDPALKLVTWKRV